MSKALRPAPPAVPQTPQPHLPLTTLHPRPPLPATLGSLCKRLSQSPGVNLSSSPEPATRSESAGFPGAPLKAGLSSNHHDCPLLSHLNYCRDLLVSPLANASNPVHGTWVCWIHKGDEVHCPPDAPGTIWGPKDTAVNQTDIVRHARGPYFLVVEIKLKIRLWLPIASGKVQTF